MQTRKKNVIKKTMALLLTLALLLPMFAPLNTAAFFEAFRFPGGPTLGAPIIIPHQPDTNRFHVELKLEGDTFSQEEVSVTQQEIDSARAQYVADKIRAALNGHAIDTAALTVFNTESAARNEIVTQAMTGLDNATGITVTANYSAWVIPVTGTPGTDGSIGIMVNVEIGGQSASASLVTVDVNYDTPHAAIAPGSIVTTTFVAPTGGRAAIQAENWIVTNDSEDPTTAVLKTTTVFGVGSNMGRRQLNNNVTTEGWGGTDNELDSETFELDEIFWVNENTIWMYFTGSIDMGDPATDHVGFERFAWFYIIPQAGALTSGIGSAPLRVYISQIGAASPGAGAVNFTYNVVVPGHVAQADIGNGLDIPFGVLGQQRLYIDITRTDMDGTTWRGFGADALNVNYWEIRETPFPDPSGVPSAPTAGTGSHASLVLENIGLRLASVIHNPHNLPAANNQSESQIRLVLVGENVRGGPYERDADIANRIFIRLHHTGGTGGILPVAGTNVFGNIVAPIDMPDTDMMLEIVPASLALGWTGPGPGHLASRNSIVAGHRGGGGSPAGDRVITVRATLTNPDAVFVADADAYTHPINGGDFRNATDLSNWRVSIGDANLSTNDNAHGLELTEVNLMANNPRVAYLTLRTIPTAHEITMTGGHESGLNSGDGGNTVFRVFIRALDGIVAVPGTEPALGVVTTWHSNRAAQSGTNMTTVARNAVLSSFLRVIANDGETTPDAFMTATGTIVTAHNFGEWNAAFVSDVAPDDDTYVPFSFPEGNFRPEDVRVIYVTLIEEKFADNAATVANLANWRLTRINNAYAAPQVGLGAGTWNSTDRDLGVHPAGSGVYGITLAAVERVPGTDNRARLIFVQAGALTPEARSDYESLPFFIDVHANALVGSDNLRATVLIDPFTPPMTPFILNSNKVNDITIPNNTVPADGATYIRFSMSSLLDEFRTELNYLTPGDQIVPDAALSIHNWEWTETFTFNDIGQMVPSGWVAANSTSMKGLSFVAATVNTTNNTVNVTLEGTPNASGPIFIRATSSDIAGIPHGDRGLRHSFRHTAPAIIFVEGEITSGDGVRLVVTSANYTNPFGQTANDAMTGDSAVLAPFDNSTALPNHVILNPGRPISPSGVRHITVELQGGATFNANELSDLSNWIFETYYQLVEDNFVSNPLKYDTLRDLSRRLDANPTAALVANPAHLHNEPVFGLTLTQVIPVPGHPNRARLVIIGDAELLANAIIAVTVESSATSYTGPLTALLRVGEDLRPRLSATTQTGAALSDNIPDNANLDIRVWIENDWITRLAGIGANWQVRMMNTAQKNRLINTVGTSGGLHPGRSANDFIMAGTPGLTTTTGTANNEVVAVVTPVNFNVGQLSPAATATENAFSWVDMRIPSASLDDGLYVVIMPTISAGTSGGDFYRTNSLIASYLEFDSDVDYTLLPVLPLFIPIGSREAGGGGGGGGSAAQARATQGRTAVFQAIAPPVPVAQDDINTPEAALAHVQALVDAVTLPLGMTKTINTVGFVAAAGGNDGSFVFNVRVDVGTEAFAITTNIILEILADPDEKTCECGKHPEGSTDCDYYVADTDCPNCNDMSCYECLWILHLFVEASARGMTIPEFIEYFVNFITGFYAFVMEWSDHIYEAEGVRLDFYETLYWLESVGII